MLSVVCLAYRVGLLLSIDGRVFEVSRLRVWFCILNGICLPTLFGRVDNSDALTFCSEFQRFANGSVVCAHVLFGMFLQLHMILL